MRVFVVLFNNDQSYEDFNEWVSGVFDTIEKAVEYAKVNSPKTLGSTRVNTFQIEEWDMNNGNNYIKNYDSDVEGWTRDKLI